MFTYQGEIRINGSWITAARGDNELAVMGATLAAAYCTDNGKWRLHIYAPTERGSRYTTRVGYAEGVTYISPAQCRHEWHTMPHGIARHCNRCGTIEPVPALDPRRDPQTLTPDELRGWRVTTEEPAPAPKPTHQPCQACGGTGGEYDPGVWMYPDGSGEPPSFEACPECLGHQVETAQGSDDWQDDPLCPNCGERLNCAYEDAGDTPCANCGWTR